MTRNNELISLHHQLQYQHHYAANPLKGNPRPNAWLNRIEDVARLIDAKSIIDYGCGVARGLSSYCVWPVADYDPGVPGLEQVPERADLVVSIHMLEHVEHDRIEAVIDHLLSLAIKAALIVVSCEHSTKVLPDGTPWHTCVHDYRWWELRLGGQIQETIKAPGKEYATLLLAPGFRVPYR
jgi:hypothetical protein